MSEAQNHEIKSNSGASPFITPSPSNPEWDRLTHKSVIVDFEVGEQGIAIFDIASTQRRSGHAREALKILKRQFGHIHAEGVIEEWPEAIGFWQQMIDEGLTDSATKTDGGTLSPSNGSISCAPAPWQDETIAANGRPIKENFSNWFEDSKVVDESGLPLVVYHGTAADIKAFDPQMVGSKHVDLEVGEAYFFTTCTKTASWYAADSGKQQNGGANVMPVYLSLQNPLIVDFQEEGIEYLAEDIERAKANGYDGLIAINYNDGTVSDHYIAFNPSQIKSAIGATFFLKESKLLVDPKPMETIMKKSTQEKQQLANQAFENYEFGDGLEIVGTDGWDTTDPKDFIRVAYARNTDNPNEDSEKISFHVRFDEADLVEDVYALECKHGAEIGHYPAKKSTNQPSM